MKAKRSLLNLIFGLSSKFITIGLGLLIPRLFLLNFGSESNGLVSSIGQIIVYMSLFEAGVGAASLQALYKPISKDDKHSVSSILAATSIYYKKTGIYYFFSVILLALVYPIVVDTNMNKLTVMIIIIFTGIPGAINYYFQGKYRILLSAVGKDYINTTILTIINIFNSIIRIVLLLNGFDIATVQATYLVTTCLQIGFYQLYIKGNYKWINLKLNPDFNAISQKSSALVHQISTLIFNNTDLLILTVFTNLKVVSVYVLYNLIFSNIDSIISTVDGSFTFALGQTYHEKKDKFLKLYDAYEVYFMAFVFSLFTVLIILILPFMKLYTLNINDVNYLNPLLPILFVALKLLSNARSSSNNMINIAGHFKKTQSRSILESVINVGCSITFVHFLGIYGVLLGTIVALLYRSTDMIIYANKIILKRSPIITFRRWFINIGLFCLIVLFNYYFIHVNLISYTLLIIWGIILGMLITPIYIIVNSIFEQETYNFSKSFFRIRLSRLKKES